MGWAHQSCERAKRYPQRLEEVERDEEVHLEGVVAPLQPGLKQGVLGCECFCMMVGGWVGGWVAREALTTPRSNHEGPLPALVPLWRGRACTCHPMPLWRGCSSLSRRPCGRHAAVGHLCALLKGTPASPVPLWRGCSSPSRCPCGRPAGGRPPLLAVPRAPPGAQRSRRKAGVRRARPS